MAKTEENLFPQELRNKAVRTTDERGWRFEDVPHVAKTCQELGFAILGGQAQFYLPDGTCDMYWLNADPKEKTPQESWIDYSKRSVSEFLQLFNELTNKTNFEKEGVEGFDLLKKKQVAGVDILKYLCFIIYPISETHYSEL